MSNLGHWLRAGARNSIVIVFITIVAIAALCLGGSLAILAFVWMVEALGGGHAAL